MGLFKKKANTDEAVVKRDNSSVDAKKKKKSDLIKVLDESVWESVHEDFKSNKQFIIKDDDGNTKYVALLFDTMQVGGLAGKDAKKDESKGSIIEAIRTGRIKTYIRNEMLMDETFVIIPDMETLDNMDEFNLFMNVDYVLCTVDTDGTVNTETINGTDDDNEVVVKFKQVQNIVLNDGDVNNLFPERSKDDIFNDNQPIYNNQSTTSNESYGFEEDVEDLPEDDIDNVPDDLDDDIPDDLEDDLEDVPSSPVRPTQQSVATAPIQPQSQPTYDNVYNEDLVNYEDVNSSEEGGYDEYEDITEEIVHDFVVRKFYSDDLGLEVSTQPFDAQFLHGNAYLPFNENRGTGWLNEYLSNIAKDANTRMERMHNENLFRMRERYMRLIQSHCANIAKSLDISDDSTQYGKMRFAIEQNKSDNLDMIEQSISEKKDQLEASWYAKLEQVGNEAAAAAKQQYIDRYGRTHDNDIFQLESREKDEIERDYQNSLKRMNEDRRSEASKLLDLAVNETLKEMSSLYLKVLRDEKKEYIRLQNEMTRFIDDNRKDEKARIDALAEENRQVKKANEVRNDYTAKIKAMAAEFDLKKTVLQADIDKMQREHDAEIRNYQSEWNAKLDEEKRKSKQLQEQIDELLHKYSELDDKKSKEYEERIREYENRINAFDSERKDNVSREAHIIESHKRANTVSVFLVIAILIASLGVGFMIGSIVNVRKTSEIEKQNVYKTQMTTPTVNNNETELIPETSSKEESTTSGKSSTETFSTVESTESLSVEENTVESVSTEELSTASPEQSDIVTEN